MAHGRIQASSVKSMASSGFVGPRCTGSLVARQKTRFDGQELKAVSLGSLANRSIGQQQHGQPSALLACVVLCCSLLGLPEEVTFQDRVNVHPTAFVAFNSWKAAVASEAHAEGEKSNLVAQEGIEVIYQFLKESMLTVRQRVGVVKHVKIRPTSRKENPPSSRHDM